MSEGRDDDDLGQPHDATDEDAPTPFDHPLFFPALLFAGLLWFGYDGWLNPDYQPGGDKHESMGFSRWGAGGLLVALLYSGYRGLQELRESSQSNGNFPSERRD